MDFDELGAFLAVAETGSIAAGARRLKLARSTLIRRIRCLERRLDVSLVVTSDSGIELSSAGRTLAEHGYRVLAEAQAVRSLVRATQQTRPETIHAWAPSDLHTRLQVLFAQTTRLLLPETRIVVRTHPRPVEMLAEGADLVLHLERVLPEGPFKARRLRRDPVRLYAHQDYLDGRELPKTVAELSDHELIHWDSHRFPASTLPLLDGGFHHAPGSLSFACMQATHDAVLCGLGIGFIPPLGNPVEDWMGSGLVPILHDAVGFELYSWLVFSDSLSQRPGWDTILDHVVQVASQVPNAGPR